MPIPPIPRGKGTNPEVAAFWAGIDAIVALVNVLEGQVAALTKAVSAISKTPIPQVSTPVPTPVVSTPTPAKPINDPTKIVPTDTHPITPVGTGHLTFPDAPQTPATPTQTLPVPPPTQANPAPVPQDPDPRTIEIQQI